MKRANRMPKKEYFRMRLTEAIKSGNTKKANYYESRLLQMGDSQPKQRTTKEEAIAKCREVFKDLDESGRLIEANRMITIATSKGHSVNEVMAFLKEANVMSDTELMHSVTF